MNSVRKWWNAIVYAKAVKTDDEGNQRGNPIDAARTLKFTDGDSEPGFANTADVGKWLAIVPTTD